MKLRFKKIASILASAILLGSTVGFATVAADLSSYPSPFVQNGAAAVTIVYGADANAVDMEAASLFSSDLASELASQTAQEATSTTTMAGENVDISLSSRDIYYNDFINVARTSLSESHLPTMLAKGKAMDKQGVSYPYRQQLTIGSKNVTFGKSGETIDPVLYVDVGTTAASSLYNYTITFDKAIEVNSSDVVGYTTVIMQNKPYLIGSGSLGNSLVLYESGTTIRVEKGKEQKVTLGGVEHTLVLEGTAATPTAYLKVDGVSNTVAQGSSATFAGDVVIYAKTIFHASVAGDTSWADLVVGERKMTLTSGSAVTYLKEGTTTTMDGTYVSITNSSAAADINKISAITVAQAYPTATHDYLQVGDSFSDRIFGGIKMDFSAVTPALDSAARDKIAVETDNCVKASVTFTSALAGSGGGRYAASGPEATIWYAMDRDQDCASGDVIPILANDVNKTIHVSENDTIDIGDLVVVNDEDEGRILQLMSAGLGTSINDVTKFKDVITNEEFEFVTGQNNYTSTAKSIGSGKYYVNVGNPGGGTSGEDVNAMLTYGAGSSYGNVGTQITLFPRVKLKSGEWLTFLTQTAVTNGTTYSMPGIELLSSYKTGLALDNTTGTMSFGNLNYQVSIVGNAVQSIVGINAGGTNCTFNATSGPALLLMEEKRVALGDTNGQAVCIPLTTRSSGPTKIAIGTPMFTDNGAAFVNKLSPNTNIYQNMNRYGTFIELNKATDTGYKVTIGYPDEQMYVNLFIAEIAAKASTTEVTSSGVVKLGDVVIKDTEAEAQKPTTNLIVIGGSAINRVTAKLLNVDYPTYGSDKKWQDATGVTGEGQAIIKLMANPYLTTQKAMLVAGWSAADTMAAAKEVVDKHSGLSGDEKKIGTVVAIQ